MIDVKDDVLLVSHRRNAEFAVFEDDTETAYLYAYDAARNRISDHFHLYNDRGSFTADDILLIWSRKKDKLAVFISESLFAIYDFDRTCGLKGRDLPPNRDNSWFVGFEEVFS